MFLIFFMADDRKNWTFWLIVYACFVRIDWWVFRQRGILRACVDSLQLALSGDIGVYLLEDLLFERFEIAVHWADDLFLWSFDRVIFQWSYASRNSLILLQFIWSHIQFKFLIAHAHMLIFEKCHFLILMLLWCCFGLFFSGATFGFDSTCQRKCSA